MGYASYVDKIAKIKADLEHMSQVRPENFTSVTLYTAHISDQLSKTLQRLEAMRVEFSKLEGLADIISKVARDKDFVDNISRLTSAVAGIRDLQDMERKNRQLQENLSKLSSEIKQKDIRIIQLSNDLKTRPNVPPPSQPDAGNPPKRLGPKRKTKKRA